MEKIIIARLEDMPKALTYLIDKVDSLEKKVSELSAMQNVPSAQAKEWMNIDELCQYLPMHPAKQTVYGWVSDKVIPYHKQEKNKFLPFSKTEIDDWMYGGRHKTNEELEREAQAFVAANPSRTFNTMDYGNH